MLTSWCIASLLVLPPAPTITPTPVDEEQSDEYGALLFNCWRLRGRESSTVMSSSNQGFDTLTIIYEGCEVDVSRDTVVVEEIDSA